jgi:Protein of unknown function (DUF4446)
VLRDLTSPAGLVALGAAVVALLALVLALVLLLRTRRLRTAQTAVLGDGRRDLVAHAERLGGDFVALRKWVEGSIERLDDRTGAMEAGLRRCLAYHAVLRYDAYGELSGRQSSTIALLDAERSGVVISSIHHRDHARIYVKPVDRGQGDLELSPEEVEAVEAALAAERI